MGGEEHIIFTMLKFLMYPIVAIITATLGLLWKSIRENKQEMKETLQLIHDMTERLVKVETEVKTLESDHDSMEKKVDKMNEKIDGLPQKVVDLLKPFLEKR